jgi:hypothetical protein
MNEGTTNTINQINAYALVIGISRYWHVRTLPQSVINDAEGVASLLRDPAHCNYQHVELLTDNDAMLDGCREALKALAERCNEDSVALIYFSGHGGHVKDGPGAGQYILPVDADYTSAESLADTAISGAEFTKALQAIPARKVIVLFDCCHSGGIGDPKAAGEIDLKAGLSSDYYEALQAGKGRVILASCRDSEFSWVKPGASNSVFTTHLLAGLRGGITSEDGLISIFDLFEYLQPRVTADEPNQHPIFKSNIEENFPIAMYLGAVKKNIPSTIEGFRYDAYICYVDKEPDVTYVWDKLVPSLEEAGLKVAVSEDVEQGGVARVVSIERAIKQSKRTIVVISENFLTNNWVQFQDILAITMGINEGTYRLLPVKIMPVEDSLLPERIRALVMRNLVHPKRTEQQLQRLIDDLKEPLPHM